MSLLLYQNQNNNQNMNDLKRMNDSMSEKIKQNKKQKVLFANNIGSNITSGINTEKRLNNNNFNNNNIEELNINNINNINNNQNNSLIKNASQSSLSVDLNRFKINPNTFNNSKIKSKLKLNQKENFETFNPAKDNNYISINNSNENIDVNNINNDNNINEKKSKEKNNIKSLLKNFNPYDIKTFLGDKAPQQKSQKKKLTFVNNIPPSTSNLQMILYNKKMEDLNKRKNPEFIFKEFYQKESRRMLVEYLKIYKDDNISLKNFMKNENINPLVLLNKEQEEENLENKSNIINNNDDTNINISYLNKEISQKSFSKSYTTNKKGLSANSTKNKFNNVNSFKMLSTFLNDINDESQEKSFLIFLSIPRILGLVTSLGEKLSYVFCSSPTNISCIYGIETYIFKWNDCKNYNLIGYFDLINVDNCYVNPENKKRIDIYISLGKKNKKENNKVNEENYYCIEATDEEIAQNYVQAINFVSQLIKYRVYLKQKKEGKLINYNYNFY